MPPGRKPPAQTYLPPHLRRSGASGVPAQAPRSLEEVAPDRLQILVRYSDGGPFSMEGCPDPVADDTAAAAQGSAPPGTRQVLLNTPPCPDDYDRQQLLTWFEVASSAKGGPEYPHGDYRAVLVFPAAMTKAERAAWHNAADRCRLKSQSQGVGAGRHLTIGSRAVAPAPQQQTLEGDTASAAADAERAPYALDPATDSGGAGSTDLATGPPAQHSSRHQHGRGAQRSSSSGGGRGGEAPSSRAPLPRWKRVWLWCQMEGQFEHSQGEVKELLASGAPLPPAMQEVINRRDALEQLMAALAAGDAAAALALVQQHPKLAWTRHDTTEDYPAHVAAAKGQGEVLAALLAAGNNVLEQKNRQRDTPVMVAAACGTLKQLEPVFEQQGDSYQRQRANLGRLGRGQPQGPRAAAVHSADGGADEGTGKGANWRSSRDQHDQQSPAGAGAVAVSGGVPCREGGHTAPEAGPSQAVAEGKGACSWLERRRAFAAAQQQQKEQQQQEQQQRQTGQ